jgi:predicted TIM-barrel fold metal-dependent hydrolase
MNRIALAILSTICCGLATAHAQEPPTPAELGVIADHHLHIRTAVEIDAMVAFNISLNEELRDRNIDENMPLISAADLIAQLDQAGIKYGTVLSSAYFFGMPEYEASDEERRKKTQELNDLVADEVAQYPQRLRAFCGVNPLSSFAVEEVTRCAEDLGMDGVKVHFANSDVNLINPDHLGRLQQFFKSVRSLDLPVALHFRTRNRDFGRVDVENFVNEVLVHVPGIELYIAHLSGWGGNFDIAATVTRHPTEDNAKIAEVVRRIGTSHFFVGSDWPAFNQPRWVPVNFRNNVLLTEKEHDDILDNVAPYFER